METKTQKDFNKFIFVEGDDDFHFLVAIMKEEGIEDVWVEKINGKSKLQVALSSSIKLGFFSKLESLFIVVDADESFDGTEKSIKSILNNVNLPSPEKHAIIKKHGDSKVSFFILPGLDKNGALEDLIIDYASKKKLYSHVDNYFDTLKEKEIEIQTEDHDYLFPKSRKKATVQVFLSSHNKSDTRIGTSVQKKIIDTSDAVFDEFKKFLREIK